MTHILSSARPFFFLFCIVLVGGIFTDSRAQDADAKVVSTDELELPDGAEEAGVGGTIVLTATVDKTGTVKKADVLAGPAWPCGKKPGKHWERVRETAREHASAAKFAPAVKNGKPEDSDVLMIFSLGDAYRKALKMPQFTEVLKSGAEPPVMDAGVIAGKSASRPIRLPKPEYPAEARMARASGTVPVRVLYDESGNVTHAGAIGGNRILQNAARDSACRAKFEPMTVDGKTVKVTGVIVYNFFPGR